ncbi:MAG: hypothetical protein ACYC62_08335, partial [Coriobacteriia bacterium]
EMLRCFIEDSMPPLGDGIPDSSWEALSAASIELVPGLVLHGEVDGKAVTIQASLHLDRSDMRFFFEKPEQVGRRDEGGALVADAFDLDPADRLSISLAWVASWQKATEGQPQGYFPSLRRMPEYVEGDLVPEPETPPPGATAKKASTPRRVQPERPPRTLKDVDALSVNPVRAASAPPDGAVSWEAQETKLEKPRAANPGQGSGGGSTRGAATYTPYERQAAGLRMLETVLAKKSVQIEDTTTQLVGADAIATDGCYYELKVHAGTATGGLNLQPSEVLQARHLGDKYVLVVVENVEGEDAPAKLTFIPNPLKVLTVHPIGKIEVTGYDDPAFEQFELR